MKAFTDIGRRADSDRIEKETNKREETERADWKKKPNGKKSAPFKSGKSCKRSLYLRISLFLEDASVCDRRMYRRDGYDRVIIPVEMGTVSHCIDRHVFSTPGVYSGYLQKMYEQKRFADASTYMEQMLYAFQKSGKVLSALKETKETFEPGHMRDVIEAITHLEAGRSYTEKGVLRESLDIVEKNMNAAR